MSKAWSKTCHCCIKSSGSAFCSSVGVWSVQSSRTLPSSFSLSQYSLSCGKWVANFATACVLAAQSLQGAPVSKEADHKPSLAALG